MVRAGPSCASRDGMIQVKLAQFNNSELTKGVVLHIQPLNVSPMTVKY